MAAMGGRDPILSTGMELRHLRYFLAVAEERHFGRAAARLGIAQPPLSQQIQALERELGAQLFRRIPRHLELTDAGEVLLREARWILTRTEQAIRGVERAARGEAGKLRIGFTSAASFNAFVPATIRAFQHTYPGVSVSLREADSASLCRSLSEGDVDVAFLRPLAPEPEGIRLDLLFEEDMLAALPVGHPLENSVLVPLATLSGAPFILFPRWLSPPLHDAILTACCKAGFVPNIVQEAPQVASAINLVAAGIGVTIVPASMQQIHTDGVIYRPLLGNPLRAPLTLASRRGEASVAVRNFMSVARNAVLQSREELAS
jgi:DNA-binding transcriptional LysR family regulator